MVPGQQIATKVISAVIMMAALLFLTSANYWTYGFKKEKQAMAAVPNPTEEEPDSRTPVPNSSEEKASCGLQNLSEYLHDQHYGLQHPVGLPHFGNRHDIITFPIHHPELLTPPPKANS
jgi:hypothetical protein